MNDNATKEELEKEMQEVKKELEEKRLTVIEPLKNKISFLQMKLNQVKFGCKGGDVVEYENKKYQIAWFEGDYWPVAYKIKKDGTISSKMYHLYNFLKNKEEV